MSFFSPIWQYHTFFIDRLLSTLRLIFESIRLLEGPSRAIKRAIEMIQSGD